MNNFFCLTLLMLILSCKGQKNKPKDDIIDTTYSLVKEKVGQQENKTFIELYITRYVDSLNFASNEKDLPQFLSNCQFDYSNRGAWESFHNPISLRAQIINRITNCRPLQLIVNSSNESFKRKPYIQDNLAPPFIELSFYDLVLKRIKTLNCNGR